MPSDEWYLSVCDAIATASKDQSTQLGCVVVGSGGAILSTGYNSFPRGIDDSVPERQERPLKYKWFCHAEANAIANAARLGVSCDGGTLYCQWLPCPACSMLIIGAGIRAVIVRSFDVPARWEQDMLISQTMMAEAGVLCSA